MAWDNKERDAVVKWLAVVCEVTGAQFSDAAKKFLLDRLEPYSAGAVVKALGQCASQCKQRVTLADIVERIESDRSRVPGVEVTRRMLEQRNKEWSEQKRLDAQRVKQLVAHITEKM
jgi:hypothetical protein